MSRGLALTPSKRHALLPLFLWVLGAVLLAVGALSARASLGKPFPSFVVDPFAVFSAVYFPTWKTQDYDLRALDQVIAVDGTTIGSHVGYRDYPGQRVQRAVDSAYRAGRDPVPITILRHGVRLKKDLPIRRFSVEEAWFFFGVYSLMAALCLWAGFLVYVYATHSPGGQAYLFQSVASFIFLVSFFDYHTEAWLVPLFWISVGMLACGSLWLAYAFPAPPVRQSRWLRQALSISVMSIAAVAAYAAFGPLLGHNSLPVRIALNSLLPLSMMVLAGALLFRLKNSEGQERAELLSAAIGLAVLPVLLALGIFVMGQLGDANFHLFLPFLIVLLPMSIGYSLIRHNILDTAAVLRPSEFWLPLLVVALLLGSIFWWVGHHLMQYVDSKTLGTLILSGTVFCVVLIVGRRLRDRFVFAATQRFGPSIQDLSEQLSFLEERAEIQRAIEKVVRTWLQADKVEVMDASGIETLPHLPSSALGMLQAGNPVQTTEDSARRRRFLMPMRSQRELQAVLVVGAKPHTALYTSADLDLLSTVASLAAVALHNAESLRKLEALRRLQVEAGREEKLLALETLVFAIEHEFRTPLNFIKHFLRDLEERFPELLQQDSDLAQDMEHARYDVGFMDRMVLGLKRRKLEPHWTDVPVLEVAERARTLLRERLQGRRVSLEVPPDLCIQADSDMLLQVFANLLRNAAQAAGEEGEICLRAAVKEGHVLLEVWDTGPGVPPELESEIFKPYFTTNQGNAGLGLVITQRILNKFRWKISVHRENGQTCFRIIADAGERWIKEG